MSKSCVGCKNIIAGGVTGNGECVPCLDAYHKERAAMSERIDISDSGIRKLTYGCMGLYDSIKAIRDEARRQALEEAAKSDELVLRAAYVLEHGADVHCGTTISKDLIAHADAIRARKDAP